MEPFRADDLVILAKTTPVSDLPKLVASLAESTAICNMRLLTPEPVFTPEPARLIGRKETAKLLGVSVYYLENKRLPCQTRIGRKVLYNLQTLKKYIAQGHIPFEDRCK